MTKQRESGSRSPAAPADEAVEQQKDRNMGVLLLAWRAVRKARQRGTRTEESYQLALEFEDQNKTIAFEITKSQAFKYAAQLGMYPPGPKAQKQFGPFSVRIDKSTQI